MRRWRFIHMLAHIPLGFVDWAWANRFHDWTASQWKLVCPDCSTPNPTPKDDWGLGIDLRAKPVGDYEMKPLEPLDCSTPKEGAE